MSWPLALAVVAFLLLAAALKLGRFVFMVMLAAVLLLLIAGAGLFPRKRPRK